MLVKWYKDEQNDGELFISCDATTVNGVAIPVNAKLALTDKAYKELEAIATATDKLAGEAEI